jgi:hypothetical protein
MPHTVLLPGTNGPQSRWLLVRREADDLAPPQWMPQNRANQRQRVRRIQAAVRRDTWRPAHGPSARPAVSSVPVVSLLQAVFFCRCAISLFSRFRWPARAASATTDDATTQRTHRRHTERGGDKGEEQWTDGRLSNCSVGFPAALRASQPPASLAAANSSPSSCPSSPATLCFVPPLHRCCS